MKFDADKCSPVFNFPVLIVLTSVLCLASYHVFGLSTAIGVATGATVLAFCTVNRKSSTEN